MLCWQDNFISEVHGHNGNKVPWFFSALVNLFVGVGDTAMFWPFLLVTHASKLTTFYQRGLQAHGMIPCRLCSARTHFT